MTTPTAFFEILGDFLDNLELAFPELIAHDIKKTLDIYKAENLNPTAVTTFSKCRNQLQNIIHDITVQNESIFECNEIYIMDINLSAVWNHNDITPTSKNAIWEYLLLLTQHAFDAQEIEEASLLHINNDNMEAMLEDMINSLEDDKSYADVDATDKNADADTESPADEQPSSSNAFDATLDRLKDMFSNFIQTSNNTNANTTNDSAKTNTYSSDSSTSASNIMETVLDQLKTFLETSKVGHFALEFAEELMNDPALVQEMENTFGELASSMQHMQAENSNSNLNDLMKTVLKNPKKLLKMCKKIIHRFNVKIAKENIDKDELLNEINKFTESLKNLPAAFDFVNNMKSMFESFTGAAENQTPMTQEQIDRKNKMKETRERMQKRAQAQAEKRMQQEVMQKMCQSMQASASNTTRALSDDELFKLFDNTHNSAVSSASASIAKQKKCKKISAPKKPKQK